MAYIIMYPGKINSPATTLSEAFTSGDNHIHVADTSVFLAATNCCTIGTGEDAVTYLYTGISAGTPGTLTGVSVLEGSAKSWDSATTISRTFTAYDYNTLKSNVDWYGDHGNLDGLSDDDHTQYIKHSLAASSNDFLVASGVGVFIKKTLAEVKTVLGLGSAAYTASTDYAVAAKGVTNGDSHDHAGGDGAQIDHGGLGGLADDDHTQYIKHALATAANDFVVASGSGAYVKKTLAETQTILVSTTTKRSIVLTAAGGYPLTTGGCAAPAKSESSSNKRNYYTLDFDTGTDEKAEWLIVMPDNYDGSTITAIPYWTAASGSGTVCFAISGRAYANDDAIDQALGTSQISTDTLITALDVHVGPATSAITIAGSPAGGQIVSIRCMRDVSEDTLGVDAKLIALKIEYGINAWSD